MHFLFSGDCQAGNYLLGKNSLVLIFQEYCVDLG
jgi:hypothetical protein